MPAIVVCTPASCAHTQSATAGAAYHARRVRGRRRIAMTTDAGADGADQPHDPDVRRVEERDHDDRATSSTMASASEEELRLGSHARSEQREDSERERDVGRHRHSPTARACAACVPRGEDQRGNDHAAECGDHRKRCAVGVSQLTLGQLSLDLEADDEEEEGHQDVVDPLAHRERPEIGPPHGRVRGRIEVRPCHGRDRGGDEREARVRLDGDEVRAERGQEPTDPA